MQNCDSTNTSSEGEQRQNVETARFVDCAIDLQRQGDDWGARDYLASVGVAPHTILRVMSCSAFRRKRHR